MKFNKFIAFLEDEEALNNEFGYSPFDLPSITYTDAKVSSSIITGTGVSQWTSLSGTQNLTEDVSSAQPLYNLTGLDGNPAVVFDGVNDKLSGQMVAGSSFTLIFLVKTSASGFLFGAITPGSSMYIWTGSGSTFEIQVGAAITGKNITGSWLNNNKTKIVIWRYDGTHASSQVLVNGVLKTTTNNGANTNNPGVIPAMPNFLMARTSTNGYLNGAVSYFNYRNTYLTDEQVNEEVKFILKDKLPTALLNSNGLPVLDANQDLTY